MSQMLETLHLVKGLDPVADAFAGTKNSDVVSMRGNTRLLFIVYIGVGATGTSTFTVEACDDVTPTNTTAIAFWSREITTDDTPGAVTRRAAAGFVNTAGSSKMIAIEVAAEDVAGASVNSLRDNHFVRLTMVESVNSPVLGSVLIIMGGSIRYAQSITDSVIT